MLVLVLVLVLVLPLVLPLPLQLPPPLHVLFKDGCCSDDHDPHLLRCVGWRCEC